MTRHQRATAVAEAADEATIDTLVARNPTDRELTAVILADTLNDQARLSHLRETFGAELVDAILYVTRQMQTKQ